MRIAQVSPLYESVPPQGYGGTERVVSFLTEELVRSGHDVTLFASGDSTTSARLVPGHRSIASARSGFRRSACASCADARAGRARPRASSTSCTTTSTTCTFPLSRRARRAARDDAARPAGLRRTCNRSMTSIGTCRSSRFPMANASRCRRRDGIAPFTTACRSICSRLATGRATICCFSDASRRKSASIVRSRSRVAPGMPLKIAAKIDEADQRVLRRTRSRRSSSSRLWSSSARSATTEKNALIGGRARAVVPDRLARALRPRHD